MDDADPEDFSRFLVCPWSPTRFLCFRAGGRLVAVAVTDVMREGLSSVYTFFDPDLPDASFGTYNILWQAAQCAALGLPYLYLGYWIAESRKMAYKATFRPVEGLRDGGWGRL